MGPVRDKSSRDDCRTLGQYMNPVQNHEHLRLNNAYMHRTKIYINNFLQNTAFSSCSILYGMKQSQFLVGSLIVGHRLFSQVSYL